MIPFDFGYHKVDTILVYSVVEDVVGLSMSFPGPILVPVVKLSHALINST